MLKSPQSHANLGRLDRYKREGFHILPKKKNLQCAPYLFLCCFLDPSATLPQIIRMSSSLPPHDPYLSHNPILLRAKVSLHLERRGGCHQGTSPMSHRQPSSLLPTERTNRCTSRPPIVRIQQQLASPDAPLLTRRCTPRRWPPPPLPPVNIT